MMTTFNWRDLMIQWNQELLADEEMRAELPPEVIASGWLGYPGATAEQLAQLEERLGTLLPPSYREFLQFTNGWRATGHFIPAIWSTEEVEWFAVRNQDTIDAWQEGERYGGREPDPAPDEEYLAYGEDGAGEGAFRSEYLQTALEISDREVAGTAVYLLNPQIVTPEGEWEAWFFASWNEGATRYRSFWNMMQDEYKSFLNLREDKTKQAPSSMNPVQAFIEEMKAARNDPDPQTRQFAEWIVNLHRFFSGDGENKTWQLRR